MDVGFFIYDVSIACFFGGFKILVVFPMVSSAAVEIKVVTLPIVADIPAEDELGFVIPIKPIDKTDGFLFLIVNCVVFKSKTESNIFFKIIYNKLYK